MIDEERIEETTENNENTETEQTEQKKSYEDLVKELAKANADKERLKTSLDRTSSEAASFKKKYREKLNEEEQLAEARQEHDEYVRGLEKQVKTNDAFKRYTDLGMSTELAMQTAEFDVEGDVLNVTKNIKAFQQTLLESEKSKWLKSRQDVHSDNRETDLGKVDKDALNRMNYHQRLSFAKDNPELYATLTKE